MDWVKGRNQPEEEEEEDPDDDDDDDDDDDVISTSSSVADFPIAADESEIIYTSNQFLHVISQRKAYVLLNKLPSGTLDALNTAEQFVLASKLRACRKQIKIYIYRWKYSN